MGARTLRELTPLLTGAHTILWNGPLGFTEKGYTKGSLLLLDILRRAKGNVVIGGGDTHVLMKRYMKKVPSHIHISTSGGAMLVYLSEGTLPGMKALMSSRL